MDLYRAPKSVVLSSFVAGVWICRWDQPHARERLLPSGQVQLLVDLKSPSSRFVGPATEAKVVPASSMTHIAGVVFRPGGAAPFLARPCAELADLEVSLEDLWGRVESQRVQEAVRAGRRPDAVLDALERVLVERLEPTRIDRLVLGAMTELNRGARVADVVAASGVSRATLTRRLHRWLGLGPKAWASVARFQRAAQALAAGRDDLADLALACGFHDQSHLTHAFRRHAGLTPGAYRPRPGAHNHVVELD